MATLRAFRLAALTFAVLLATVASSSAPVSAAAYAMPAVVKLTSTMPASSVMPIDVHTLCLMRMDLQTYPDYDGRAVCYRTFGSDPPPTTSTITQFTIPANHVVLPVEDLGSGAVRITLLPCTEVLPGALAVEITLDFQLSKSGLPTSGQTDLFVDNVAPFTCGGLPDTTGTLTMTPYDHGHDEDGDGCSDWNELGEDVALGGLNDPFNPTDCSVVISAPGLYDVSYAMDDTPPIQAYRFCKAYVFSTTPPVIPPYQARAFCYLDSSLDVNLLGYPGVTGDGIPGGGLDGGGPWWAAIPIEPPCANPSWCTPTERLESETNCSRYEALDEDQDGTVNDGCPSEGFADTDSTVAILNGELDAATNTLKLRGCFPDEDASTALVNIYVEWSWNVQTGAGSSDMWALQSLADCMGDHPWGTYIGVGGTPLPAFDDVYLAALKRPNTLEGRDSDGDGASDEAELGSDGADCGLRDPFNPYDWYDVNQDGVIDLANDILGVMQRYSPAGAPPYDIIYDRGGPITGGAGSWSRSGPDGVIDLPNDILGVMQQYHPGACPSGS